MPNQPFNRRARRPAMLGNGLIEFLPDGIHSGFVPPHQCRRLSQILVPPKRRLHAHAFKHLTGTTADRRQRPPVNLLTGFDNHLLQRGGKLVFFPWHAHQRHHAPAHKSLLRKRHHAPADDPRHPLTKHLLHFVHNTQSVNQRQHRINDQNIRTALLRCRHRRFSGLNDAEDAVVLILNQPKPVNDRSAVAHRAEDLCFHS